MAMRPEDREKLTMELTEELGPAGFLLKATEVYIQANAPDICNRHECVRLVGARASELAMRACMDNGQPNVLGRTIDVLSEYVRAVCNHPEDELAVIEESLAVTVL